MTSLIAAALCFAGIHLLVSGTRVRGKLVSRAGERNYTIAFSLATAVLLGWLIWAYGQVRVPIVTGMPELRWAAAVLNGLAFLFITLGVLTPGPTIVGGESLLDRDDPAKGIHRITRHPFLWGVALWAATHIGFNPAGAHYVFFGTFLAVALAGTVSIDAKRAARFGEKWQRYVAKTSNVPFAAIVAGRNRLAWNEFAPWKLGAAAAAFALLFVLHGRFFGLPAM